MVKIRTKKQIYNDAKIKDFEVNVNYHLYFDKTKMTHAEFLKLLNYLSPVSVIFDNEKNLIDMYKVKQYRELKLIK